MSDEFETYDQEETIYDRVSRLEDEIATLRNEVDVMKMAMRNKLARHEIKMIKKGQDVSTIIDCLLYTSPSPRA